LKAQNKILESIQKRLDSLFELVGELTIAGGSVSSLDPTNGNFNATDFRKATLNLTKIITDIQSIEYL
jgi:chemotaxis protein histidine kinase CheA